MDKIPPHNLEAEQSVLGALLIDRDAVVKIAEKLRPDDFYRGRHRLIYEAILSLYQRREPADVVTVADELRDRRQLREAGGTAYLATLVNQVPTAAHIETYAQIVRENASRRRLISAAARLTEEAFSGTLPLDELLNKAEEEIFAISQQHLTRDFVLIKETLAESFDRLEELHKKKKKLRGIPTGFRDIDNILAGLQDGNLVVLAARPSMGKTSLALNIAQYVTVHEKIPVGFFSLESSKEELVDRLLSSQADIDYWKITTGNLKEEDFKKLGEAFGVLGDAPLFIDDTPGMKISEMRTKARRLQLEHQVRLLIVDYLQLAVSRNLENRVQEVSEISQGLKNIARELNCPVLALSQLSRAVETRGSNRPQLSDLRDSGSIEQDADVVMFLYRVEEIKEKEEQTKVGDHLRLFIAKHRNGPTGEIDLIFRGNRTRFYGMEKKRVV